MGETDQISADADDNRSLYACRRPPLVFVAAALAVVAIHLLLVFILPSLSLDIGFLDRTWGFDTIRYYPGWTGVAYGFLALATVPRTNALLTRALSRLATIRKRFPFLTSPWAMVVAALPLFWIFRQEYAILGDGFAWVDGVGSGEHDTVGGLNIVWKGYEHVLHLVISTFELDPFSVVQVAGCALGAAYVVLARAFALEVARERWSRDAVFGLLILSGAIQFYFGYGEGYGRLPVFLLGHTYTGIRAIRGRCGFGWALLVWAGALLSHSMMIALLPAGLYLIWMAVPQPLRIKAGVPAITLVLTLATAAMIYRAGLDTRPEGVREPVLLPFFPSDNRPYAILSLNHFWERLNGLMLMSPAAPLILVLSSRRALRVRRYGDTGLLFLLLVSTPMLAVHLTGNAVFGALDWDIAASTTFPLLLLSCYLLPAIRPRSAASYAALFSIVLSAQNTIPWVFANADRNKSFEVMYRLMDGDPVHYFRTHHWSVRLAVFAHRSGRHDVAIEALEKGVREEPENERINFNLAGQYHVRGRHQDAIDRLAVALESDPTYVKAAQLMIQALKDGDRREDAHKFAREYPEWMSEQGRTALIAGNNALAARYYDAILKLGARMPEIYLNLGTANYREGRIEQAMAAWRRGLENFPDSASLLWNLGVAAREIGRLDLAADCVRRILDVSPDDPEARTELREIEVEIGDRANE